ncbi:hypothetical protein PRIPAC_86638 [Pristionchus pacificus]|uniref:Uncharacterized protein n=1 Tax=Pristionchus pacificus TaxID=54126 RepID=A0A2A6BTB0_PRIPA|nr:hypothetical protein PRIPAC_86638 [Pristionchus pacificus]|eukprot:PDM69125.1 hypothetical protein PRIPAC_47427 [Pristionchus pacificus]
MLNQSAQSSFNSAMLEPKLLFLFSVLISQAIAQCSLLEDYGCNNLVGFCASEHKKADCTCAQCTCYGNPCRTGPSCKSFLNTTDCNNCLKYPCPNTQNYTCTNGYNTRTCDCIAGKTGNNCDFNIGDPCAEVPCLYGGYCASNGAAFTCQCKTDRFGPQCQFSGDPCSDVTCAATGTCNTIFETKQHNATSPLNPAIKQRARDTVSSRTTASVVCVPQAGLAVTAVQRMIPAPPSPVLMTASAFQQRTNHTPIVSVQGVTRPQIALALDSCFTMGEWLNVRYLVTDITPVSTLDECKYLCVAMAECAACSFSKSYSCALLGPDTNRRLSSCFAPAVLYERDPTCANWSSSGVAQMTCT